MKLKILTPLQKLPKNVEGFEKLPKSNKLPNLITLATEDKRVIHGFFFIRLVGGTLTIFI